MARAVAELPKGSRLTDHISLGVIGKTFPAERVKAILREMGRASQRERQLPAHVVVYYVIAMALYMHVCCREVLRVLLEGLRYLGVSEREPKVTGKSGISQARGRLGWEPMKRLHDEVVGPIAVNEGGRKTKGAWYRRWHGVSLDGSTLDVADTAANAKAFGRPGAGRGESAYPKIRFLSLVENGTHVLYGTQMAAYKTGEATLAPAVLAHLKRGDLCLADRNFLGYALWCKAKATGADLLWRMKINARLPRLKELPDGSYVSKLYPSDKDRRHDTNGQWVRVIEYTLDNVPDAEPLYRLATTLLDPAEAPAEELASLYQERWEIETVLDEFKTHLRGRQMVLRSKTPDLVRQEFYGLLLAHFAIRGLMHEAALLANEDPDRLSFTHTVNVVRRKLPLFVAIPPYGTAGLSPSHVAGNPRRARRLQPRPQQPTRRQTQDEQVPHPLAHRSASLSRNHQLHREDT